MRDSLRSLRNERWMWLLFSTAFVLLAALFPASGDDWQWGSEQGLQNVTINGRYLGNLAAMLLIRVRWLYPFAVGIGLSFLAYTTHKVTGGKMPLLSIFLVLALPTAMFTQVCQWTSGFSNYALPVILLSANLLLFYHYSKISMSGGRGACYFAGVLIAVATQLFVEHITIFSVLFSLIYLLYKKRTDKRWDAFVALCFVGYVLGAVAMLANPCYWGAGSDGAHSMPQISALLSNIYVNYFTVISRQLILDNLFLNIAVATLLVWCIWKSERRRGTADDLLIAFFLLFAAYVVLRQLYPAIQSFSLILVGEGILAAVYCLLTVVTVWRHVSGASRTKLLFAFLALALVNAPLFVVQPIGQRCFFVSYVIFVIVIQELYRYMRDADLLKIRPGTIAAPLLAMTVCVFSICFVIYGKAHLVAQERESAIETQLAAHSEVITIPAYPAPEYVWNGNPPDTYVESIFKRYYGIPAEYTLEVVY